MGLHQAAVIQKTNSLWVLFYGFAEVPDFPETSTAEFVLMHLKLNVILNRLN